MSPTPIDASVPAARVLVIDDETQIRRFLDISLRAQGYQVRQAATGQEGLQLAASEDMDLVILDIGLPDMEGHEVLEQLRQWSQVPVIMLTVRAGEAEKVRALDGGANDYVTKPFGIQELMARVRALLRRSGGGAVLQAGDLRLDPAELTLTGPAGAAELSRKECALLEALLRAPGRLQARAALLARVWGPLAEVEDANLDCYIHFVRRRLRAVGSAARVVTVRGSGYRLEVPPC